MSPLAATETFPESLLRIDGKGGGFLLVKRAKTGMPPSALMQGDILLDECQQIAALAHLINIITVADIGHRDSFTS